MQSFIERIISQKISLLEWLLGFSGILMVRFFLEALSNKTPSGLIASDASTLIHYYLYFLAFALVFMFFLKFLVLKPEHASLAPKITVVALASIFIAPLFDYIYAYLSHNTVSMAYLFDGSQNLLGYFFTFFGPNINQGITLGIRIEILIILASIFIITYKIKKKVWQALVNVFVLYILIFLFLSAPSIIAILPTNAADSTAVLAFYTYGLQSLSALNNLHPSLEYGSWLRFFEIAFNFAIAKIFFILVILLSFLWFYFDKKVILMAIIQNSRIERVVHYVAMVLLGILLINKNFSIFNVFMWLDWLTLLILLLAFYFAWMFAVCTNDLVDINIDKISNQNRPLVKKSISGETMQTAAILFLMASILGGFLAGYYALFFILAFNALYFIYSVPPTRFKTIPFFSSLIISLCCLSAVLAGFFTFSPNKEVVNFSAKWMIGITLIFFLWSHIRDMKDIEGDKRESINTVPVIFGRYGARVVGILSSLAYLLVPVFFAHWTLVPSIVGAIANYYFVTGTIYQERLVFGVYQLYTITLIILFFLL